MRSLDQLLTIIRGFSGLRVAGIRAQSGRTKTHIRILLELDQERCLTDMQLRTALGTPASHLSKSLVPLIEEGLIEHAENPAHKSQRLLYLTPLGRKEVASFGSIRRAHLAAFMGHSDPELTDAIGVLARRFAAPPVTVGPSVRSLKVTSAGLDDLLWLAGAGSEQSLNRRNAKALCDELNQLTIHLARTSVDAPSNWVVHDWGQPVAGCIMTPAEDWTTAEILLLRLPDAYAQDAGRLLLRECVKRAEARPLKSISLTTVAAMPERKEVLHSIGFQQVKVGESFAAGHPQPEIVWTRQVSPG